MRRAILVTAGTAAGLAAVLTYTPRPADTADAALFAAPAQPVTPSTDQTPSSTPTTPQPTVAAATSQQTIDGKAVDTLFGPVQVEIVVEGKSIVSATAIQYPNGDRKSIKIAKKAIPVLAQETIDAQSADIATVSGASFTSEGWIASLTDALSQVA